MKIGGAAFMSHLDLQRALLRGLRRAGLNPVYSAGFNPHPKLSLALPLTLGFESLCEYLEADIEGEPRVSVDELNRILPEGVIVLSSVAAADGEGRPRRSMAARVDRAEYDIAAPRLHRDGHSDPVASYLAQERIMVDKENRKTGGTSSLDIRPLIKSFTRERALGGRARYTCDLSAAAGAALNPLTLIGSFYTFCGEELDPAEVAVTRTKILLTG
jgi:radical SAM-linked protein